MTISESTAPLSVTTYLCICWAEAGEISEIVWVMLQPWKRIFTESGLTTRNLPNDFSESVRFGGHVVWMLSVYLFLFFSDNSVEWQVTGWDFSLLRHIQIYSGTHSASYTIETGKFLPGVKGAERAGDVHLHLIHEVLPAIFFIL